MLSGELYQLRDFFLANPKVALCFTGDVNSAYLLHVGRQCCSEMKAYYVKSEFQPQLELESALQVASQCNLELKVLHADMLGISRIKDNLEDRCYHCKKRLLSIIKKQARADGYDVLIDGANASAGKEVSCESSVLAELSIRAPFKEFGITKTKIRMLSKKARLSTWNKPNYPCLAAQVPTGIKIKRKDLLRIERAENELYKMGFTDFRLIIMGNTAKLQIVASQIENVVEYRQKILEILRPNFDSVLLDLDASRR